MLTATRGAALYVGALLGPGLLLVPALAAQAAGPASALAWAALLLLSAPIAITFAALGVRHPVSGGVATYVERSFGPRAAAVTGTCFLVAVVVGSPAVALMGGYYVADLTGSGEGTAVGVAVAVYVSVVAANAFGLRISSGVQLGLSALLVAVIAVAVGAALPGHVTDGWAPFAPHGWWAVGTAATTLVWLVIGWEAMAQLAGDFRDPARDVPRAVAAGFGIIMLLYVGVAVATIVVPAAPGSRVPLADLVGAGFGELGRDVTAVLALALTMGGMNVYVGSAAKLASALAADGALPRWLAAGTPRSVPRRPLLALVVTACGMFVPLVLRRIGPEQAVLATSACFVAVYLITLASAYRLLRGVQRAAAGVAFVLFVALAPFLGRYLLLPAAAAFVVLTVLTLRPATPTGGAGPAAAAPVGGEFVRTTPGPRQNACP